MKMYIGRMYLFSLSLLYCIQISAHELSHTTFENTIYYPSQLGARRPLQELAQLLCRNHTLLLSQGNLLSSRNQPPKYLIETLLSPAFYIKTPIQEFRTFLSILLQSLKAHPSLDISPLTLFLKQLTSLSPNSLSDEYKTTILKTLLDFELQTPTIEDLFLAIESNSPSLITLLIKRFSPYAYNERKKQAFLKSIGNIFPDALLEHIQGFIGKEEIINERQLGFMLKESITKNESAEIVRSLLLWRNAQNMPLKTQDTHSLLTFLFTRNFINGGYNNPLECRALQPLLHHTFSDKKDLISFTKKHLCTPGYIKFLTPQGNTIMRLFFDNNPTLPVVTAEALLPWIAQKGDANSLQGCLSWRNNGNKSISTKTVGKELLTILKKASHRGWQDMILKTNILTWRNEEDEPLDPEILKKGVMLENNVLKYTILQTLFNWKDSQQASLNPEKLDSLFKKAVTENDSTLITLLLLWNNEKGETVHISTLKNGLETALREQKREVASIIFNYLESRDHAVAIKTVEKHLLALEVSSEKEWLLERISFAQTPTHHLHPALSLYFSLRNAIENNDLYAVENLLAHITPEKEHAINTSPLLPLTKTLEVMLIATLQKGFSQITNMLLAWQSPEGHQISTTTIENALQKAIHHPLVFKQLLEWRNKNTGESITVESVQNVWNQLIKRGNPKLLASLLDDFLSWKNHEGKSLPAGSIKQATSVLSSPIYIDRLRKWRDSMGNSINTPQHLPYLAQTASRYPYERVTIGCYHTIERDLFCDAVTKGDYQLLKTILSSNPNLFQECILAYYKGGEKRCLFPILLFLTLPNDLSLSPVAIGNALEICAQEKCFNPEVYMLLLTWKDPQKEGVPLGSVEKALTSLINNVKSVSDNDYNHIKEILLLLLSWKDKNNTTIPLEVVQKALWKSLRIGYLESRKEDFTRFFLQWTTTHHKALSLALLKPILKEAITTINDLNRFYDTFMEKHRSNLGAIKTHFLPLDPEARERNYQLEMRKKELMLQEREQNDYVWQLINYLPDSYSAAVRYAAEADQYYLLEWLLSRWHSFPHEQGSFSSLEHAMIYVSNKCGSPEIMKQLIAKQKEIYGSVSLYALDTCGEYLLKSPSAAQHNTNKNALTHLLEKEKMQQKENYQALFTSAATLGIHYSLLTTILEKERSRRDNLRLIILKVALEKKNQTLIEIILSPRYPSLSEKVVNSFISYAQKLNLPDIVELLTRYRQNIAVQEVSAAHSPSNASPSNQPLVKEESSSTVPSSSTFITEESTSAAASSSTGKRNNTETTTAPSSSKRTRRE